MKVLSFYGLSSGMFSVKSNASEEFSYFYKKELLTWLALNFS
jgi:hypothetical protein